MALSSSSLSPGQVTVLGMPAKVRQMMRDKPAAPKGGKATTKRKRTKRLLGRGGY